MSKRVSGNWYPYFEEEIVVYRECTAKLSMLRMILGDSDFDEETHVCKIIRYIPEKESIYLLTGKTELPVFSLDALYECSVHTEEEVLKCQGFIK